MGDVLQLPLDLMELQDILPLAEGYVVRRALDLRARTYGTSKSGRACLHFATPVCVGILGSAQISLRVSPKAIRLQISSAAFLVYVLGRPIFFRGAAVVLFGVLPDVAAMLAVFLYRGRGLRPLSGVGA